MLCYRYHYQVCTELRTSADNVALPACGATAAADCRLAGRAAVDRRLLAAGPTAANPQQRRAAAEWRDRQTD